MMKRVLMGMVMAAAVSVTAAAQVATMFPPVRGTREMVGAANNQQVEAGMRLLAAGGNAVDAGVAAVLAAAVTEQSRFGLGGEMPLIVKMADRAPVVVSAIGVAPRLATAEWYRKREAEVWETGERKPPIPSLGIRSAVTPGVFDGLMLALSEHGTRSYCEVAAPAIEAAGGFPIGEEYAKFIGDFAEILRLWPDSAAFFLKEDRAPKPGEVFRSPVLGRTLEMLCQVEKKARGNRAAKLEAVRREFAEGSIAKRIAAFSEAQGGLLRYEDLAGYRAELDAPRSIEYRGYTVVKPGFWSQGPVLLQALAILEGFDLKGMGHNGPEYLHTVIEAVKLAFADRDRYYGDPKHAEIPEKMLLSREYAAERRGQIDAGRASLEHRPGAFGGPLDLEAVDGDSGDHDTTCVNVIDRWGNAFSATPSGAWLPSVIAGDTGIPLSTRLQSFVLTPGHANVLAPGKRPRVTLSPTMVLKDGKPWLVMSTPGGDNQDQAMLQVLLNLIEFGMGPQAAVEAPRFQTEHYYGSFAFHEFGPGRVALESRLPAGTIERMLELGHRVTTRGPWSNTSAPVAIRWEGGVLDGGADPRRSRFVFGR
ncbi:MAG: gamma-glutamyltransferase family protein [Solibacteraceae bacterium]|nr:gamma-glutamyltransferase family protein [Solibacteraceae bacterium]